MLVAIIVLMIVLVATASTFVQSLALERHTTNLNRARALAESVLAEIEPIPPAQIGHYSDDPYPYSVLLPDEICYTIPYAAWYGLPTGCQTEKTVAVAATRPTTAGIRVIPPVAQTFSFDDTSDPLSTAAQKKLAQRTYLVQFYVTSGAADEAADESGITALNDRKASVIVSWLEGGQTKKFALARYIRSSGGDARRCQQVSWKASGSDPFPIPNTITTGPTGVFRDGFMHACVDTEIEPLTPSARLPAGVYSNPEKAPQFLPVTTTGATNAKIKWTIHWGDATRATSAGRYEFLSLTSVKISPFLGAQVDMVPDATKNTWTYTQTTSVAAASAIQPTKFVFTFSDGTSTTRHFLASGSTGVDRRRSLQFNEFPKFGVLDSAPFLIQKLPEAWAPLRWNTSAADEYSGAAITRLCTKPDGSLWQNQKLLVDMVNGEPQDEGFTTANQLGGPDYTFLASSSGTAAPEWQTWYGRSHFSPSSGAAQLGSRYIATVSGSGAVGGLNTTRWSLLFPTSAYASSNGFWDGAPRFLQKYAYVSVFQYRRKADLKYAMQVIKIPVYQSASGTQADCVSGNAAQPTNYPPDPDF